MRSKNAALLFCLLALVLLPSFPGVRAILAHPLTVTDPQARGDACYVLAGGETVWERLNAAADLVHLGRVPRIYLMDDPSRDQYSARAGRSLTRREWYLDYLAWRGVPAERVSFIPRAPGFFGTRAEAGALAAHLPVGVHHVVIVSSAPHMRRALLAFRRALPAQVEVVPYAATGLAASGELYHPLWIEYLKLLVYGVVS
ncbi:YdcF family protein [Geomonas agri]|uniref:YdcF family protein n=1 Tax=Geomonas agri TaxID=2873702 RepID=UPI001CD1F75B|nr:YdcF family protein [Geomonas agri]